ncbi:hypothetical protein BC829DRAFT_416384, partial [Chytridium lagenaria]
IWLINTDRRAVRGIAAAGFAEEALEHVGALTTLADGLVAMNPKQFFKGGGINRFGEQNVLVPFDYIRGGGFEALEVFTVSKDMNYFILLIIGSSCEAPESDDGREDCGMKMPGQREPKDATTVFLVTGASLEGGARRFDKAEEP